MTSEIRAYVALIGIYVGAPMLMAWLLTRADLLTPAQGEIKTVKVHKSWWRIWK